MIKRPILPILFLFLVTLTACLDEIELETADRPEEGYVIQSELVLGTPSYIEVKVEELFFYSSNINRAVNDAEVKLVSSEGPSYLFDGLPPVNGVYSTYLSQSTFPVTIGKAYRIEVELIDGTQIESTWETIRPVPQAERIDWKFTEVEVIALDGAPNLEAGLEFGITTPLLVDDEKARLRWEFIDAYQVTDDLGDTCYVENEYLNSRVIVLDGNTVAQDSLTAFELFSVRLGRRHIEGYYLSAFQQSLSPNAYRYWREVAALGEREGTVFDNPAGTISTNLKNLTDTTGLVYGYFSAYSQDTIRRFLSREDTGELELYCPRPPNMLPNPPPTVCDGCLFAAGSSFSKPPYWE